MATRTNWSREQLLVACHLYCVIPFGKFHSRNAEIIHYAHLLGRTPSSLAMKLSNLASLDPAITSTGRRGLAGASLADKAIWNEMQADWERFALESQQAVTQLALRDEASNSINAVTVLDPLDYEGTGRQVTTTVRVGQAFFRRAVLSAYQYRCCISGLTIPKLLVASHIVPWRNDATNRLNPRNGLCLSSLHDKAFDAGIICLTEDFKVHVSPKYRRTRDEFFASALAAFEGSPIMLPDKFQFVGVTRATMKLVLVLSESAASRLLERIG